MRDCTLSMIVRVKDYTHEKVPKQVYLCSYALLRIENFNLDPQLFR